LSENEQILILIKAKNTAIVSATASIFNAKQDEICHL